MMKSSLVYLDVVHAVIASDHFILLMKNLQLKEFAIAAAEH